MREQQRRPERAGWHGSALEVLGSREDDEIEFDYDEALELAAELPFLLGGLGGTFRAWISTPASSPLKTFVQSAGPYARIDGLQIAENRTSAAVRGATLQNS